MTLEDYLKKYFGYPTFRPGQREVITALLAGKDVLGVLPTATGKSLCYQLPSYLIPGLTIIVSPLIALMEDQVSQIKRELGSAVALNSQLTAAEKEFILIHIAEYKFLFVSPEMLWQKKVLQVLQKQKIALFVVDEAHCISQWGIDFRPEYRQLNKVKEFLNNPLTLALTATAPPFVQKDIAQLLLNSNYQLVKKSVDRKNIRLFVRQTEEKLLDLENLLKNLTGPGIIYCATKKTVEFLYQQLKEKFNLGFYHGGLNSSERSRLQLQFQSNQLDILIATNAFGMGIDKSDIRFVIHFDLPDSLENYVQEIGRAGRDGNMSQAILLYQKNDEKIHHYFKQMRQDERSGFQQLLEEKSDGDSELQKKWLDLSRSIGSDEVLEALKVNEQVKSDKLAQMLAYIHTTTCRRAFILGNFAENILQKPEQCCDNDNATISYGPVALKKGNTVKHWQEIFLKLFKETN